MSEYWKSTPKYWCKHCKTFVRDTKLERTNHEATPKHQGNIKRFLRDLHRGHEREEQDQQRAKDEVSRLNGVVSGNPSTSSGSNVPPWQRKAAIPPLSSGPRQATPAERKQHLSQLAAMGVAVPEDFRREMAMAGDWQTLSERPLHEEAVKEEDSKDTKPLNTEIKHQGLNIGVRKRKYEGQDEEEEEAGERIVRKGWGSTTRPYGGSSDDVDLDALLNGTAYPENRPAEEGMAASGPDKQAADGKRPHHPSNGEAAAGTPPIKKEESDSKLTCDLTSPKENGSLATSTAQDDEPALGVVFRKRKPKQNRQM